MSLPIFTPDTRVKRLQCESQTAALKGTFRHALGHVMEWWSMHRAELAENWRLSREGRGLKAIEPLGVDRWLTWWKLDIFETTQSG